MFVHSISFLKNHEVSVSNISIMTSMFNSKLVSQLISFHCWAIKAPPYDFQVFRSKVRVDHSLLVLFSSFLYLRILNSTHNFYR